jgi:U3 small nucleolar ribonucleoprotein protein IMP4
MFRREIRERREMLFRKKKEQTQQALQERREFIKNAIDKGQPLPRDMRKKSEQMAENASWGGQIDNVDDEYRWAGCQDPKVVITTSRDPSSSLKRFVKVSISCL